MKLLVISDIHGNQPALTAILDYIGTADKVICLGDLAGYYPYINEVIETISSLKNCICVMGNHDYVLLNYNESTGSKSADMAIRIQREIITRKNKKYLMNLPRIKKCVIGGYKCFIFHGTPDDPLNGRNNFWANSILDEGLYFFGHSHKSFFKKSRRGRWIVINPGSCGLPRDKDPRASCVLFDTLNSRVDYLRVEYSIEAVADQCKILGLPEKFWKSLECGEWVK